MKLLQLVPFLDPTHGGVVSAVILFAEALNRAGHEAEILTLESLNLRRPDNIHAKVHRLGPTLGTYGYCSRLVPWLRTHAPNYEAVIVNGLWQYPGFAVWRALHDSATPYFVFTHGMLDAWFKHFYPLKHLKKWLYWPWAEYRVLRDARKVFFTCEAERLSSRQSFWLYRANEAVVPLGVPVPPANGDELAAGFLAAHPELHGKRLLLFLSRMHEMKGCDLLIEAFAKVAHQSDKLHLVMAGPDQKGLVGNLQSRAAVLGIADRITWTGMLHGDKKWGAFYSAEVFCLPSHHENFGFVVAEALACGKPVLITNKVQIWHEIVKDSAGFVEDDTVLGIERLLQRWLSLRPAEFAAVQVNSQRCFRSRFNARYAAERLLDAITESK